jgi:RNA polymerase sigma-70 factor (ECF subfamily)
LTSAPNEQTEAVGVLENQADIESCYPRLYRFLINRLNSRSAAQDLAQEAYLRLLRVEQQQFIRQPSAYLFRIAANLVYEFRLKERKRRNLVSLDRLKELDLEPGSLEGFVEGNDNPEHELELANALRRISDALDDMPPLYASILILCKRDGLSHQEIADKLNISIHTVRKYLTRAVMRCRAESDVVASGTDR